MIKKLTTLALMVFIVLSVAACGSDRNQEAEPTALPTLPPAAETETEADAETVVEAEEEAAADAATETESADDAEDADATPEAEEESAMAEEDHEEDGDAEASEHMDDMPRMTGSMSTESMELMTAAMEAAQAGDWDAVTTHMTQMMDMSTDAQQKSAIEHLVEEIEEGNTDHFLEEMEELMDTMMQVSPAMQNMQAAMTAALAGDWDAAKEEVEAAIDISTDPQEKSSLEHLLEEIDEGNADHFIEQLEAVMQGEEAAHE